MSSVFYYREYAKMIGDIRYDNTRCRVYSQFVCVYVIYKGGPNGKLTVLA